MTKDEFKNRVLEVIESKHKYKLKCINGIFSELPDDDIDDSDGTYFKAKALVKAVEDHDNEKVDTSRYTLGFVKAHNKLVKYYSSKLFDAHCKQLC